jgi:O-methyltransferase
MGEDHRPRAREPHAVAPGPDAGTLRTAYLDVLKLALCDLCGSTTTSVWRHTDGAVMSRDLAGDELQIRVKGVDWPLQGLTMIGLGRLDDLQRCVEQVVREGVEGDMIETGVWRGGASIFMRAALDAFGENDRTVWVADSFEGLPLPQGDDPDAKRLAGVDFLAVPLDEVEANFARFGCERGVRFVRGLFEDTLPALSDGRWSLVRLDGDSYDATQTALEWLYPGLSVGGHVIVDDYGTLDECRRAVDEFRSRHQISEPLEEVDFTCVRWRRTSDVPIERAAAPLQPTSENGSSRAVARTGDGRVPTMHELDADNKRRLLDREAGDLRRRLAGAEAEIAALRGSPLRGPRAWLADRLGRGRKP